MVVKISLLTALISAALVFQATGPLPHGATSSEPEGSRGGAFGSVSGVADGRGIDLRAKGGRLEAGDEKEQARSVARTKEFAGERGAVLTRKQLQQALNAICVGDGVCGTRQGSELNPLLIQQDPAEPAAPVEGATAVPARVVTIEDIARFLPANVALHAEPDGWAVVGVPANFWTYVQPLTVEAALLGEQAAVRFTPQAYRWEYGDGASTTTRSGGASWSGFGQQELTATPTSHVYSTRSAVNVSVTVIWSAEYRFAGEDWIPIVGAVSNTSPQTRMLVVKERTVLTAR